MSFVAAAEEKTSDVKGSFIDLTNQEIKNNSKTKNNLKDKKSSNVLDKVNKKTIKKIEIGKLASPSLGSIGVKTNINKKFGLNIWNNISAKKAIKEINSLTNHSSSII